MSRKTTIKKDELGFLQSITGAADTAFSDDSCEGCRTEALDYLRYVFSEPAD